MTIHRSTSLGIAQYTRMINEWLRKWVSREVQLDDDALYVNQIALKRVEEPARLQMLGGCTSAERPSVIAMN